MSGPHTPGPWRASPPSSVVGIAITAQPDPKKNSELIASVRSGVANAALIEAAPDLLASLEELVGQAGTKGGVFEIHERSFEDFLVSMFCGRHRGEFKRSPP